MIDGDGSGEELKLSELIVPVVLYIFGVDLLEEEGVFLDAGPLLEECVLAVDLFDLLGLETLLGLQFCDFGQLLVDVAHLLL